MIVIIDYGMSNLRSIHHKLSSSGIQSIISSDPEEISNAEKLILPGVGHFKSGMENLHNRNIVEILKKKVTYENTPIFGICLGMQLLLSEGTEYEKCEGLNIIQGRIEKLPEKSKEGRATLLPHVGWNTLHAIDKQNEFTIKHDRIYQYFVHSFALKYSEKIKSNILYSTNFEGHKFASMIQKINTIGMQFHPERSGKYGLGLIEEFLNL